MGRLPHHSKYELIRTEEVAKEFKENAVKKVEVLRLADFKQRFKHPAAELLPHHHSKEGLPLRLTSQTLDEADVFFFRQKFVKPINSTSSSAGNYAPELKPSCLCSKIINPDDETISCSNCSALMHPLCMRQNADRRCCECKFEIPFKLIYSLKRHSLE